MKKALEELKKQGRQKAASGAGLIYQEEMNQIR
jgi:hypothetical protein